MDFSQTGDIPRFTKIMLAFQIQKKEIHYFGNGAGHFKGGTTLSLTPFATSHMWLLQGSRPMLFLVFVQMGLLGYIIYALFWLRLFSNSWKNKEFKYSRNFSLYLMAAYIIIMFYNESLRYLFFAGIFMYFIVFAQYWMDDKEVIDS
jgi:glucan phosphoethanolaminetransferase (alkaline phosphatase superfamily)